MKAKIYAYLFFLSIVSVSIQQCCGMESSIDWFNWFSTKPSTKPSAKEDEEALFRAISKRDYKELKRLLEDELINPNIQDQNGVTPLYVAVRNNFLDEVEILLSAGANPNMAIELLEEQTPLFIAVVRSFLPATKLLLEHGADPNKKDSDGNTPLYGASKADIVDLLLKRGADPNVIDNKGNTPLSVELSNFGFHKAAILLKYGAHLDDTSRQHLINDFGSVQNVLNEAAIGDWDAAAIKIALAFGADKEAVDAVGNTPLLKAVINNKPLAAAALLAAGANILHENILGQSAWSLKDEATPEMRRILIQYHPPVPKMPVSGGRR